MSVVRLPEYEAEFEPEVFEIYALPRSDANGAILLSRTVSINC